MVRREHEPMQKLTIEDDEGKAVVFPLIRSEISIGRQASNLICLTERNVSRHHARLVRRDGRYVLEDLSSYLGTRLNGTRIAAPTALKDGDRMVIGDYRLALTIDRPLTVTGVGPQINGHSAVTKATEVAPPMEPSKAAPSVAGTGTGEVDLTPSPPGRLVAMTAPLRGQEFVLSGASLIIGRTSDNDIVLPHKSISRHHAKILRDGQRYVVVDLQSGNGVKVNGADYRRVELKSGDILALGRMRLRFVAAGDRAFLERRRFRFGTNAKITLGVAAAGALTAALLVARTMEQRHASAPPVLPAEADQPSGAALEGLEKAFERQDYTGLLKAVANLGDSGIHADRARVLAQAARSKLVAQHLMTAEKHRSDGNCGLARKEAEAALALESYNQAAQGLIARCSPRYTPPQAPTRLASTWRPPTPAPARERAPTTRERERALSHERAPARERTPVRERAERRVTTAAPTPAAPQEVAPAVDIPLTPPPDKPRKRAIDSSDPYAKDRL
jgi:pSer/pThr/pTyr-binding forkhead associated (FHA) protein